MDLISRKALRRKVQKVAVEAWKLKMTASVETVMNQFLDFLEQAPSVPAVPLDRLCEWLAEHYGSPCQLAEIDCYPQCEPDENGECYGMRTDDKKCWHDYLTKWTEGLDVDRP